MNKLLAMKKQLPKIFFYIILIFFSPYIFSQSDLQIKFDDLNYRNVGPTRGGRSSFNDAYPPKKYPFLFSLIKAKDDKSDEALVMSPEALRLIPAFIP